MAKIRKLNELSYAESFIQVNYTQGFKYIDKAGEILNLYSGEVVPKNQIGVEGLLLEKPVASIEELKVSGTQFWCHLLKPANLGNAHTAFYKEFKKSFDIIKPASVVRVGWRNYFILEGLKADEIQSALEGKKVLEDQASVGITIAGKLGSFEAKIELSPLKGKDNPKRALLFDVDLYSSEILDTPEDVNTVLDKLRKTLAEKMPEVVNGIVK